MTDTKPSAYDLWVQADGDRERYRELLLEHGLLIPREPGDDSPLLPCGWPNKPVGDPS